MSVARATLTQKADEARRRLDEHVCEIVRWHFDPKTGCPFWLEKSKSFDFDPLKDVNGYDDLKLFGGFQDEWLRGGPVRRWLPKGLAGKPAYVFETGGSTGVPKSRLNVEDFQRDYEIFGDNLSDESFPRGADWLMLGPTGPRRQAGACPALARARRLQGAHHRPGADNPAGPRQHPLPVHHAEAAGVTVREDFPAACGYPGHLLRWHRDERPVQPLRA
jgi:hypothetical protein